MTTRKMPRCHLPQPIVAAYIWSLKSYVTYDFLFPIQYKENPKMNGSGEDTHAIDNKIRREQNLS